jgi:dTDP-4-dehydrorhamnose 3,5-epimerase
MDKMKFNATEIKGVFFIENFAFEDTRGKFVKIYQESIFKKNGMKLGIKEHFFSVSNSGVIRGLHFQAPPFAQEKLIYVPKGKIYDVILDIRTNSESFGRCISVELSEANNKAVFIPCGCAHGFQSLEDGSITVYSQGAEYHPSSDMGINPLSLEIKWPLKNYLVSDKDQNLPEYSFFQSPFEN